MLVGRVALVTGSARGLGRGIAMSLAAHGALLIVNYRDHPGAAEVTVKRIATAGGQSWPLQADVTDFGQVNTLMDGIVDRFGRLDILVNNVGTFLWRDVVDQTEAEWHRIIQSNLSSVFFCTRAVLPIMRRQRYGRIINLAITGGQHCDPAPHMAAYAAAKAGVIAFSRSVALEEAPNGITVNVVCPGIVRDTELSLAQAMNHHDASVPVGRPGTWEDVARAVLFFATEEASFVTVLEVNGGWQG